MKEPTRIRQQNYATVEKKRNLFALCYRRRYRFNLDITTQLLPVFQFRLVGAVVSRHLELNNLRATTLRLTLGPTLVDRKLAEFRYEIVLRVWDKSIKLFLREIVTNFIRGTVVAWRRSATVARGRRSSCPSFRYNGDASLCSM